MKSKLKLIEKLRVKTKALWFAATIIQEKIEPNKTVDEVYEMLKFMGKNLLAQENKESKEK